LTNGEKADISEESSGSEQDHREPKIPKPTQQDAKDMEDEPVIEYEDISAEVEQRLRARRIEELLSTPLTAKKRKREEMEDEDNAASKNGQGPNEAAQASQASSPPKKLKYFVQMPKRKEVGHDQRDSFNDRPQKKVKPNLQPQMRRGGGTASGMGNGDARKRVRR
jgi:hypothetical protein